MISNKCVLADTKEWFARAVPAPTDKNLHVQLGVHFEEVGEMIDELDSHNLTTACLIIAARRALENLATHLKQNSGVVYVPNPKGMLDSICDQLVTATGVGHMQAMDPVGGLNEVNRSNWSKFVDGQPVFDDNRKIKKGPDYSKPNLDPFL